MPPTSEAPPRMTLAELYREFFVVGARGFGGTLPWARRMLVEERRWLTAREFLDAFSVANFLPGPNVVNIAIVVGSRFHGAAGALAAFGGLVTLPVILALTLAALYGRFGHLPGIDAVLRGVGAAAAGLVLATGLRMTMPLARAPRALAFLVATFVAVALLRFPLVPVLIVFGAVSVAAAWRHDP